jgi:hypothetical protein
MIKIADTSYEVLKPDPERYPKHNKEFYNFLSIYMPDWKERKKILDYEVVQGI